MIALFALLSQQIKLPSSVHQFKPNLSFSMTPIYSILAIVVVFSVTIFQTTRYVASDYENFRTSVEYELATLGLQESDYIIVDSSISTEGWREFGKVSIWFDFYFPFNPASLGLYRDRWIESCGPVSISSCGDTLFSEDPLDLVRLMKKNSIIKFVTGDELSNYFVKDHFKLIGQSESKWSYELLKH